MFTGSVDECFFHPENFCAKNINMSFKDSLKTMANTDYYELLGVSKTASADELKKAYRKAAMKWHPDKNPGNKSAEAKFKEISEAYDVLKDEQKRAAYDRFGHDAFTQGGGNQSGGGGFQGASGGGFGFDFSSNFSDIFDEMFGGGFGAGGPASSGKERGSDMRYNVEISLEEAFKGATQKVRYVSAVKCGSCNGSGAEGKSGPVTCSTCKGHGKVRAQQGFFTIERTCPTCHGQGQMIKDPCRKCGGEGRVRRERSLDVKIPAGVDDGTRIRLTGEGEAGFRGGPSGDLYVFIQVKTHRFFKRKDHDIRCQVPLSMITAALGGEIEVPCIDETRVKVKIPEGTQSGKQFRLKGKGMSILRSTQRGDMYIEANVETPVNLTSKQKDLLKQFNDATEEDTSPTSTGFFKKVKEFWEELGGKENK
jgi:molecular chaperone DnaJ